MPTLDWIGKKAVVNHHREVPYRLIHCDKDLSYGDPEAGNLLVQGDNLEALKALLPYYAGKVKCIYIDPPYNTGNESWVYNDNVNSPEIKAWLGSVVGKEAEDLSRHDKWLCMMYPRLRLLKEFLSDDGVIFMSIDDNEIHNLRHVCDEIFGRQNFFVNVIWQKMDSPSSNVGNRTFSNYHDHTLVYARNIDCVTTRQLPKPEILNAYPDEIDGKRARLRQLRKNGKSARREDRPKMWFPMKAPDGTEIFPVHPSEKWEGRWAIGETTYQAIKDTKEFVWKIRDGIWTPYKAEFPPEEPSVPNPSILSDVGQNRQAKAELNSILGTSHGFDTPKPVGLVKRFIEISCDKDSIVMDAFAGSGTTAQAVLEVNAADSGDRKFLLVEMLADVAENITARRIERVVSGYLPQDATDAELVEGLGGGFRFCTLGEPLFDADGNVSPAVTFPDLAAHVFFCETGSPIPRRADGSSPLIGTFQNRAIYLLHSAEAVGVAHERAGNVLTGAVLESLALPEPEFSGARIIYAEGCTVPDDRLSALGVTFKQIPYQIEGI
ncbi:site-specific DNA-methyltransferase [Agrobacterium vitis]|uniref:site-specific DNA-methyltransferase n=1 Tax=Agrobacterium vitis TaxID=373 RepID=UPI003D2C5186